MTMLPRTPTPEVVARLTPGETFHFACHPRVSCFTECCRMLELALTPYDVLRLRRGTGLNSQQLHDRYIIEEQGPDDLFPKYYLTMIDDGRASCAFVDQSGCTIYEHRPGACRAYPMGRAAMRGCQGDIREYHVLLKEKHCQGFKEPIEQNAETYSREQRLDEYNSYNDAMASILQHQRVRSGSFTPTAEQIRLYTLALYNIDTFRNRLLEGSLDANIPPDEIPEDDEQLLLFAIDWLKRSIFSTL